MKTTILLVILGFILAGCRPSVAYLSRDKARVGLHNGQLLDCPSTPNCVSSLATRESQKILPLGPNQDPKATLIKLIEIIKQLPRAQIITAENDYVHAVFKSKLMGYIDDVELVHIPPNNHVDVKSGSRLGRSDFGVNRDRVEKLREQLK